MRALKRLSHQVVRLRPIAEQAAPRQHRCSHAVRAPHGSSHALSMPADSAREPLLKKKDSKRSAGSQSAVVPVLERDDVEDMAASVAAAALDAQQEQNGAPFSDTDYGRRAAQEDEDEIQEAEGLGLGEVRAHHRFTKIFRFCPHISHPVYGLLPSLAFLPSVFL